MKFAKRTVSVLLAVLMLVSILPLSVSAASLKITTQPKTSYTAYGSTAKATVKATGDGLKYTWYVKNAGSSKYTKSSVTKSTYTAKMTDSVKGRSVYCVVKDKKGKTVKSSTAILRMKATITTEPKTTYAQQGATAKLTVKAKGDGLKYAWYIKNAGKTKYTKSSVTKSTYSTTMSDSVHGRYVYCIVTDKYGKTDKSKTVVLRQQATITTQPKTTSAALGETAKLTVKAKGDDLKYTWYIKNAGGSKYSKSSVTKSTYSVTMSEKVNGRYVYCVVTDKYGKTEKSKTVMLKLEATPLTITMQPEDVTCKVGDEVGFGVVVKGGTAPYTYQWEYTVSALDGWQAVPEEAILITGDMVSAVLPVDQSHFDLDFRIRCVITDAKGAQVTTNEVGLIQAFAELAFNVPPQTVTASVGDEVSFYPIVEGGKLPYTYQWQIKGALGTEYVNLEEGQYQGVTEDYFHFIVNDVEFDNGHTYRVIVTDALGNQLISDPVWVEKAPDPLTIITQPQNVTAKAGDTVSFSVAVSGGTEPYAYQWQAQFYSLDWEDITGSWPSGEQTERLSFVVDPNEFGKYKYRCVITDVNGQQVISDEVWVEEALNIVTQPQNVTAKVGDTVSFSVAVSGGTAPYTYKWQYKSNDFDWNDIVGWADGNETTLSFPVDADEFERGYQYRCIITDAEGNEVITEAAWVEAAPLTIVTQPLNVTAKVGDEVNFLAEVEGGKAPYTYQWEVRNIESDWHLIAGSWAEGENTERMSFVVEESEFEYGYQYRCVITDAEGNEVITEAAWVIEVIDPLTIVTQPQNIYAKVGDTVSFSVAVSGGTAPYTYQWQFTGDNLSEWRNVGDWATGGTGNTMSFQVDGAYEWNDHYKYRCVITDAGGNQIISDEAWVEEGLTIVTQPQNIYAKVGDTVSFSVAVSGGKAPYTYQWQFIRDSYPEWNNVGSWATGGNSNTMSFQVESFSEWDKHYRYRCVITDAAGNQIISDAAWVEEALTIVTQPHNVAAEITDTVSFSVAVSGGKAPYTYQWQIHSVGNGDVWSNIALDSNWASGQQTERLSFGVGQYEFGNYQYRCVITDAAGNQVITNAVWVIEN